jgi:general secretion pathway protein G
MAVIAIILILMSSVGFMAFRFIGKAKVVSAKSQIEAFSLSLNAYSIDCKQFPSAEQGLDSLWTKPSLEPVPAGWAGPYVNKKITTDPWGNRYEYTVPGPNGLPFGIRSLGADGREGGEGDDKDIVSWED